MIARLLTVCVCFFIFALLRYPAALTEAAARAFSLWFSSVLPSLFPFLAAIGILLRMGAAEKLGRLCAPLTKPLFSLSGICAFPLAAGLLSGYPAGANTVAQLYEQRRITLSEARKVLLFCNAPWTAVCIGYSWYNFFRQSSTGLYHAAGSFCGNHLEWYFLSLHSNRFQQSNAHSSGTKKRAFFSALFLRCKRRPFDFGTNRRLSGMLLCFAGGTYPSWFLCLAFQRAVFSACFSGIFTGVFWRSIGNDKGHPWGFPFS